MTWPVPGSPSDYPFYVMFPVAVGGIIISSSLWCLVLQLLIKRGCNDDIGHRYLAIAKGMFSVMAAMLVGNMNDNAFVVFSPNSWSQSLMMMATCGYYIHDTFYFTYRSIEDVLSIAHHIATSLALTYTIVSGSYANLTMFYQWAYESTSVPLHLRYIMKSWKMNRTHRALFTVTELFYILVYAFERFPIGLHFSYLLLSQKEDLVPLMPKILCVSINLSSVLFYYQVARLFIRHYGNEFEFLKQYYPPV